MKLVMRHGKHCLNKHRLITLISEKKQYTIPSSYDELSGKQLIGLADVFLRLYDTEETMLRALKVLMGKSLFRFCMIPMDGRFRMLEHIQWVLDKQVSCRQLVPAFRKNIFSKTFVGPCGEFDNLTIAEFHYAERFYKQMVKANESGEDQHEPLNYLVAVLYRLPKDGYDFELNSEGDGRREFKANELGHFAKQISKWPPRVKFAILMWYSACRDMLVEMYEPVFGGGEEDDDEGMFGIIRGISGPVYGSIDKVEHLNIHTALAEICKQIKESEELSKKTS